MILYESLIGNDRPYIRRCKRGRIWDGKDTFMEVSEFKSSNIEAAGYVVDDSNNLGTIALLNKDDECMRMKWTEAYMIISKIVTKSNNSPVLILPRYEDMKLTARWINKMNKDLSDAGLTDTLLYKFSCRLEGYEIWIDELIPEMSKSASFYDPAQLSFNYCDESNHFKVIPFCKYWI